MKKLSKYIDNSLYALVEFCSFFKTELIVVGTLVGLISLIAVAVN